METNVPTDFVQYGLSPLSTRMFGNYSVIEHFLIYSVFDRILPTIRLNAEYQIFNKMRI